MKRLQKGFTLIELLVVVAIIAILAGIVLVNVSTARNRAREASIISALSQIRSDKELNFTTTYQATTGQIVNTISNNGGTLTESNTATTYRASSPLPTGGWYCVDSTGVSKKTTTNPTGAACP
jgi:prepilin-type N-terminal cleavage/methylation domain-containing protein